jgi:chromosome segregation protein
MYLSKIEIFGFKSFALNVNLNFDSGITAIVGPNGCGKTNIVDALRWALGEQRYSTLRSDKMEDVIFNGTKNRKPLSMAEVSLVIENSRGILPTEYSQVTITRRVYRSGESEYLLNKVPCRLKDILDLFMDTGMGADAYSVIELKMVETILSDRTDERRKLFEEAAGVTKYKHRRKSAYRKLEDVQQDLVRVNDIVKEVQKTVTALERQSKRAEQYNELSKKLREVEIDLLEHEYAYLIGRLNPLKERFDQVSISKTEVDEELSSQETLLDLMRIEISEVERQLIEAQRQLANLVSEKHRLEENNIIGNERRRSLQSNIERYEKEKVNLAAQKDILAKQNVELQSQKEKFTGEVFGAKEEFNKKNDELASLTELLNRKKDELQALNDKINSLLHEIIQKTSEKLRLEERVEDINKRALRVNEDIEYFQNEIAQRSIQVAEMTAQDKDMHKRFLQAEMDLLALNTTAQKTKSELEALQQKEFELKNEIHRINTKVDFLRGLIGGQSVDGEGARYLLEKQTGKSKKLLSVADIINTADKYKTAIQAALGESINYLVVEKESDAFTAISDIEQANKGKAVFVCLERVPEIKRAKTKLSKSFTWANQVVKVKEPYRHLIDFLLSNIIIVEAMNALPNSLIGVKYVTLDGNIKTSSGFIKGGSRKQGDGELIGKVDQITEYENKITRLSSELDTLKKEQNEKQTYLESINEKAALEEVKVLEKEMTAIEMKIAQVEFEKKRANDSVERSGAEFEQLQVDRQDLSSELNNILLTLENLNQVKSGLESEVVTWNTEIENLEQKWNTASKAVNEVEIKLVMLQGNLRNTELESDRNDENIKSVESALVKCNEEIAIAKEEIGRLSGELETYGIQLGEIKTVLSQVDTQKREIDVEYSQKREAIHQVELKIKDDRRKHDDIVKSHHDLDVKIIEATSNIQHIKERAQHEFELDLVLKTYPEDEWIDFAAKREEVKQMKERIRMLGAINFAAFDEYNSESERYNFLSQQRDDLIEAEKTLLSTIEEINNTAQKKFTDTFYLIRENFIKTFKSLFDEGDECDLQLEEGVDPLEAKIEIIAKPRGKRPTSIDLLSGGEKTLTAIALLFAIYLVKPSPFCVLDEVDAPLDDSNIDRYTRIIGKFSDNTQFIVVTHNKRTMEAANALYGITMEEEGVSKIVTVRFNEEARVGSAAIASGL